MFLVYNSGKGIIDLVDVMKCMPIYVTLYYSIFFHSYMYWTMEGEYFLDDHSIEMAEMDGSSQRTVITLSGYWYYYGPNSVALDIEMNRLYWLGYHDVVISYTDLDNMDGIGHTLVSHYDYLWSPLGLALDADHVYWTDTSEDVVMRANKHTGGDLTVLASNLYRPRGISVYRSVTKVPGT